MKLTYANLFSALVVLAIIIGNGSPTVGLAQNTSTNLFLSWKAQTIAPSSFGGRLLPIFNSQIEAFVSGARSQKAIPLSSYNIVWYINNEKKAEGVGLIRFSFKTPESLDPKVDLKVSIPDLGVFKNIPIPIRRPEAVIIKPSPTNIFKQAPLTLGAEPYFFNVSNWSNLTYAWEANGQKVSGVENPQLLTINLEPNTPGGFQFPVKINIQKPGAYFENVSAEATFTYQP